MKHLKSALLAGAAFAGMTTHACAAPAALITPIWGFLLSSTAIPAALTGTIATIAANVIVGGALIGAQLLGRPQRPTGTVKAADAKGTFETGESSVIEGLGRVRVGGLKAFGNTDGSTRWRVVCRLQGPIDAVEAYYVGGREVTVDPNGIVASPPWLTSGGSFLKWEDKKGTGTEVAWPALVTAFPSLWTADHRVRGIAQSLLTYLNPGLSEPKYMSLYQGGVPDTEEIVRASLVFDMRIEGSHPDTPSTWVWSENGILCAVHVLRRDPAFTADRFDWALITTQVVKADVSVATKTGTEKRSRCGGMWGWEGARRETMQDILDSIGAEIRMTSAGKIWIELIDDNPLSEVSFGPLDVIDLEWACGPEAVERPNICRISYYSPERNYEVSDIDMTGIAWARIDDEVARYGPKYHDVELPFCPSASQAQRIARRRFALARGETGVATMNMAGLAAWGVYYGEIELPDLGDVEKVRFSPPRVDDGRGTVDIPFAIWPALPAWNPAIDEADAPDPIPEMQYESSLPTPSAPTAAIQITFPGGTKEWRIGYSLPAVSYTGIEANFRTYDGGPFPTAWQSTTEFATFAFRDGDYLGVEIDARVRLFSGDDGSYFSPYFHGFISVDNGACGQPTLVSGGASSGGSSSSLIASVAAPELRCAAVKLERSIDLGPWILRETKDARPGIPIAFSDTWGASSGVRWRFTTLTSDGTAGAGLILLAL
ncbi:putative antifreeze protein [Ensifer adhaerens OV14]|nr:putative antifreeze protein [Ensifer adhaerens OV14]